LSAAAKKRLVIRKFAGSPGVGVVLVDSKLRTGRLQAYFYSYQCDPMERPALEVDKTTNERWFEHFSERYEQLWSDAGLAPTLNRGARP
jgi:hypothetical protein